jgi:hypothetical protein
MITTMPFVCSICEEQSTRICVRCTKDTCSNHLCEKCRACSDCCDCEIHLEPDAEDTTVVSGASPSGLPPGFGPVSSEEEERQAGLNLSYPC